MITDYYNSIIVIIKSIRLSIQPCGRPDKILKRSLQILSSFLEKCVFETWNLNHGHAIWLLAAPVEYSQMLGKYIKTASVNKLLPNVVFQFPISLKSTWVVLFPFLEAEIKSRKNLITDTA